MKLKVYLNKLHKNNRCGYTLIELVVTMSILGIIVFMSMPKYKVKDIQFQYSVEKFKSELRKFSIESAYRGKDYNIRIYKRGYKVVLQNKVVKKIKMPEKIYMLAYTPVIKYTGANNSGAPQQGNSVYVFDSNNKKVSKITIMLGSGRVKSYKLNYENVKPTIKALMKANDKWEE